MKLTRRASGKGRIRVSGLDPDAIYTVTIEPDKSNALPEGTRLVTDEERTWAEKPKEYWWSAKEALRWSYYSKSNTEDWKAFNDYAIPAGTVLRPRKQKSRFFRHKNGFSDNTDVIEFTADSYRILHFKNGTTGDRDKLDSLAVAEEYVARGIWIEVDGPTPTPKLVPWEREDVPFHPGEAYIISPLEMCERLVLRRAQTGLETADMFIAYGDLCGDGWKWAKCNSTDEPKPCGKEA